MSLTNEDIDRVAESMPGGIDGMYKEWGFRQFAQAVIVAHEAHHGAGDFQQRVGVWMEECFGPVISKDFDERNHRFVEEAIELAQACGANADECHQLVDYVFGRPEGEPKQEVGGVMVTLAALCSAQGIDMSSASEIELSRIWTKTEAIREKQKRKPVFGPLPGVYPEREGATKHHKMDTDTQVFFYEQDFYVLSNFSSFTLLWNFMRFDTSEAAYHWEKFPDHETVRELIRYAPSAHEAYKIAERHKHLRRQDWDQIKVPIMRAILYAKACQHEYVLRKLLATGERELIEDSWRDDFWGWGENRDGQNVLGKLWMEIRAELRAAEV